MPSLTRTSSTSASAPAADATGARAGAGAAYRVLVAGRLAVGLAASLAPRRTARMIGVALPARVPQLYTDRLFGTRELLLAVQQAKASGSARDELRRAGIAVDLLDAGWAVVAGVRGHLPARTALFWTATGLSAAALGALARPVHSRVDPRV